MFYKKEQQCQQENNKTNKENPPSGYVKVEQPVYKQKTGDSMNKNSSSSDK